MLSDLDTAAEPTRCHSAEFDPLQRDPRFTAHPSFSIPPKGPIGLCHEQEVGVHFLYRKPAQRQQPNRKQQVNPAKLGKTRGSFSVPVLLNEDFFYPDQGPGLPVALTMIGPASVDSKRPRLDIQSFG